MKHYRTIIIMVSMILVASSCISRKKLTYLQYSDQSENYDFSTNESRPSVTPSAYRVMAYDNLYIRVVTPDPQWSALFNIMPVGQGGAVTEESAALFGYPVDVDGNIEIPFVGKVQVAGKTLREIKIELDKIFQGYVTDASITIRLVNNYISILGEVSAPGRYRITKDRINVFEAISMAGDLSLFSNRRKIQLLRPSPYGPLIKEFSLTDRSILTSELFYVMPNDVIYALPSKGRAFQVNYSIYSLLLSMLTTSLVVFEFFR